MFFSINISNYELIIIDGLVCNETPFLLILMILSYYIV